MTLAKIALIGSTEFFSNTLFNLFADSEFEAELLDLGIEDLKTVDTGDYDLFVIRADLSSDISEESFVDFLLSTKSFLLVDDGENTSPQYINPKMSLEDIISKVGNNIFRTRTSRGIARSSPRIKVNIPVEYVHDDACHKSVIINLSRNGTFIVTLNPPPKDSVVDLSFALPQRDEFIRSTGRVIYSIGFDIETGIISKTGEADKKIVATPGVAVFFEDMKETDREAIESFIEANSM
jgi:hypothetical protein